MKLSKNARNAIFIGVLCSVAYLAVYIARNMLSAVTPELLEAGLLTKDFVGTLSSVYFTCYAVGQLINGIIGDKIKGAYMISAGLALAGVSGLMFPMFISSPETLTVVYGLTAFFLSMIYAPMTRVVAESTEPIHAVRCSLGYTFASFFGSPLAGVFAAAFVWNQAFNASSTALLTMAALCFVLFVVLERRGIVKHRTGKGENNDREIAPATFVGKIKLLVRRDIIRYSAISMITGIVRTAVLFWMPTYFSEHLGYDAPTSALIFTVATLVIATNSFIAIALYERLGRRQYPTLIILFGTSLIAFLLAFLVHAPILNVIFLIIAVIGADGASSVMWSVYCPSLVDTGLVSSTTGFLDFLSYMAAAIATAVFGNLADVIGWNGLLLTWVGLATLGVAVMLVDIRGRFMKHDRPSA